MLGLGIGIGIHCTITGQTVERGNSAVECRTRIRERPGWRNNCEQFPRAVIQFGGIGLLIKG